MYTWDSQVQKVLLATLAPDQYRLVVGDQEACVAIRTLEQSTAHLIINGRHHSIAFQNEDFVTLHVATDSRTFRVTNEAMLPPDSQEQAGTGNLTAPMHGQLISVLVEEGQSVSKGDRLAVLEAMKMQHELVSQVDGVVSNVWAKAGSQLAAGDRILMVDSGA